MKRQMRNGAVGMLLVITAAACGRTVTEPGAPSAAIASMPLAPSSLSAAPSITGASTLSPSVPWRCLAETTTLGCGRHFSVGTAPADIGNPPGNLAATVAGRRVTLTWTAPPSGSSSYLVEAGSAPQLANLASFETGSAALSLTVDGVPDGTYYVRVRAFDAARNVSFPSNEVIVVVGGASTAVTFAFAGATPTGMSCGGSYTFDPRASDTDPDPGIGSYRMPAPFRFEVRFGGRPVFSTTGLTINVRNNIDGVEDDYEVVPDQPASSDLHLIVRTRNLAAFSSDALPTTPPWGGGFWGVFEGDHAGQFADCHLTSVTRTN